MDVSENSGIPKSSILIGFSIINHPFWGTPIFGNTHIRIPIKTNQDSQRLHIRFGFRQSAPQSLLNDLLSRGADRSCRISSLHRWQMRQHSMSFSATGSQQSSEMLGGIGASEDETTGGRLELEDLWGGWFSSVKLGRRNFMLGTPPTKCLEKDGVRALGVF